MNDLGTDADTNCWAERRVALTGATGFLGAHVALRLAGQGARVVALVRSTSDTRRLLAAGVRCDVAPLEDAAALARATDGCAFLVHAAGAVDFGSNASQLAEVNVEGTRRVLEAARAAGVRRVVYTSSIVAVGGSRRPCVLDETATWNLAERRVPYADTKRRAEELAFEAAAAGQDVVVVNPSCILGPEDHGNSEFGVLCRRFWRGRVRAHFGGGNNFVDVRDVADGILRAAQHGRSGQRYILGGENRTYGEFYADLCRAAGQRRFWVRLPRLAAAVVAHWSAARPESRRGTLLSPAQARLMGMYFHYDSTKARRELGYHPRPLHESLADAYQFWRAQNRAYRTGDQHAA